MKNKPLIFFLAGAFLFGIVYYPALHGKPFSPGIVGAVFISFVILMVSFIIGLNKIRNKEGLLLLNLISVIGSGIILACMLFFIVELFLLISSGGMC